MGFSCECVCVRACVHAGVGKHVCGYTWIYGGTDEYKCLCLLGDSQSYEDVTPCQFLGFPCESVCVCVCACMHVWASMCVGIWGHRSIYVNACVCGGGGWG